MPEEQNIVDYLKHLLVSTRNALFYSEKISNAHVMSAPDPQNALAILKGEWVSKMQEGWSDLQAGSMPLFEDSALPGLLKNWEG